ncbi:presenilin-like protein At1g08700 [Oryza brachyantha]|uniref:presenilin-like protein At1g08700 n=1 Tax=Oryza brachyantha TaxID=4533 RepID=UPI001ADD1134|nr:presenilin-like protein At1g08700 [Oryza brachyantha]
MDPAAASPDPAPAPAPGATSTAATVLDGLGAEVLAVMSPVSICMALVVLLISLLAPPSSPGSAAAAPPPVTAATLVYLESPNDSPGQKFVGALLDAAVFVALVAVVTFVLVALYYYRCTGFLKNYMRFSAFFVLFSMGGAIAAAVLRRLGAPLDAATALVLLFNASAVGVLSVFASAVPIVVRQGYMVALAVIVAAWLSRLPEWTTWIMLVALALYDLVAVLAPRGPLRMLVELASSRDDELPALVYESRPTVGPVSGSSSYASAMGSVEMQPVADPDPGRLGGNQYDRVEQEDDSSRAVVEMRDLGGSQSSIRDRSRSGGSELQMRNLEREVPMGVPVQSTNQGGSSQHAVIQIKQHEEEGETAPLVSAPSANNSVPNEEHRQSSSPEEDSPLDFEMFESTRGIKLGLGDFIFYSVLVGRAAMYDLMTVYACYLAIIAGLGCTLILLSICKHALPALPISIMLGVTFYFLTRLLMEPFVVGSSTNLVMF